MEFDVVPPDGETVNLYAYAAPLLDEQGKPRGAVGAYVDMTKRKKQQEAPCKMSGWRPSAR